MRTGPSAHPVADEWLDISYASGALDFLSSDDLWEPPPESSADAKPCDGSPWSEPSLPDAPSVDTCGLGTVLNAYGLSAEAATDVAEVLTEMVYARRRARKLEAAMRSAIEQLYWHVKHLDATAECVVDTLTKALEARG